MQRDFQGPVMIDAYSKPMPATSQWAAVADATGGITLPGLSSRALRRSIATAADAFALVIAGVLALMCCGQTMPEKMS